MDISYFSFSIFNRLLSNPNNAFDAIFKPFFLEFTECSYFE